MADKIFPKGLRYSVPSIKAQGVGIVGKLSFKVDEFTAFMQEHQSNAGWVNVDIKKSRQGTPYCELNSFVPTERPKIFEEPKEEATGEDAVPF